MVADTNAEPEEKPKNLAPMTYTTPCGQSGVHIEFRDHCGRLSCEPCNCAVYDAAGRE